MTVGIIGAGAAGMIAALKLSEKHNVVLLEKNDKVGKKILVTGNGKCNLWNTNLFLDDIDYSQYYYTDNYDVLEGIFASRHDTYEYLTNNLGIYTRTKDQYVYPYSNTSQSVRELLERKILANDNIDLITNFNVNKIEYNDKVLVYSNDEYYEFDKLIIATGLLSSNLGTNSLCELLGGEVRINEMHPALVPIKLDFPLCKEWDGVRVEAKVTYYDDDYIRTEVGELQLTDYGISGIPVFNFSSNVSKHSMPSVVIDFIPDKTIDELKMDLISCEGTIEDALETLLNYKLLFTLLKYSNIKKDALISSINIDELIHAIKELRISIIDTLDYDRSQVTTGGVSLDEVNEDLSLRKLPNVYVIGEALDIDGICGGYNLANAFITGYLVGSSLND